MMAKPRMPVFAKAEDYVDLKKWLIDARPVTLPPPPPQIPHPVFVHQTIMDGLRASDTSHETWEQHVARRQQKAAQRAVISKASNDLADALANEIRRNDPDRHWIERATRPWPGAVGSAYGEKL